jgi:hypothetical protein
MPCEREECGAVPDVPSIDRVSEYRDVPGIAQCRSAAAAHRLSTSRAAPRTSQWGWQVFKAGIVK